MTNIEKIKRKQKSNYRHGDLKNGLIQAALQLVQQRSTVEFTVRELAEKTGVTHAAAYRHFSSKNEIMKAIAIDGFELLKEYFTTVIKNDPGDIVSLGVSYVKFAVENPSYFRVMFHPDIKPVQEIESSEKIGSDTFLMLRACIEYNQKNRKFSDRSAHELSIAAWSLVHGLAVLWTGGSLSCVPTEETIEPNRAARAACEILLEGLKSQG